MVRRYGMQFAAGAGSNAVLGLWLMVSNWADSPSRTRRTATQIPHRRLLNHRQWGNRSTPFLPFGFLFALLVRRTLARGNLVQCALFRFHPHVGVAREHGE
jgi:hypothetical protein